MRARVATLLMAAGLALGGCAYGYDGYGSYGGLGVGVGYGNGYGYGYPYGGYGYGAGYGYPYGGYGGYGGYYGSPYFGWYNDYYYPGTGYYVYDRYRQRRVMTDAERQYWNQRTAQAVANHIRGTNGATTTTTVRTRELKPNWSGFNTRRETAASNRQTARTQRQTVREERRSRRTSSD